MTLRRTVVAALPALLLLSASCTLGPDPEAPPATAADSAPSYVNAPAATALPADDWWRRFADPVTERLVVTALSSNPNIRAAAASVIEAQATLRGAAGARLPQLSLALDAGRNKFSMVLPQVGRVGIYSTTFTDQLQVSYQVDLFGRLARTRQAAWARLLATEADRRAVSNTLVAEVIRARIQIASLQEQLRLARENRDSWRRTSEVVESRYSEGLSDAAELHLVRSNLAQAEASLPPLRSSLASARTGLDVLLGRRPGTGAPLPDTLPTLPDLSPVPAGLPASLLDRRPDLVAARMRFSAATAQVGVALANLYPNLTLSAAGGFTGSRPAELTRSADQIYSAALSVLAPLFKGGQLRAEVEASRARAEQAAATYASAVLQALREVEDALVADRELQQQLKSSRLAYEAAGAAEQLARSRYDRGTGELLDLLAAERSRELSESALITLRSGLWNTRVALFLALGGDWAAGLETDTTEGGPSPEADPPQHNDTTEVPQ